MYDTEKGYPLEEAFSGAGTQDKKVPVTGREN